MLKFANHSCALLMAAFLSSTAAVQAASTLGVGDQAPALSLTHWYKGTPIKAFEPGKTYVVEFWATWCGPCKVSIPHLTELQKKYKDKVTVLGVDVWERPDEETDASIARDVRPFVEKMGAQMDYLVAGDGVSRTMQKTWYEPARQDGIPTSFVIDGKGQIAWIGYPTELDAVLEKITAGTWDVAAEKKRVDDERAMSDKRPDRQMMADYYAARKAKDYAKMQSLLEAMEAASPRFAAHPDTISMRLEPMLQTNASAAVAYIRKLTAPDGVVTKNPKFTWSITRLVPEISDSPLTQKDWKAISDAIEPMMSPGKGKYGSDYSCYAELLRRAGDLNLAVFYQRKAVALTTDYCNTHADNLLKADTDLLKSERAQLKVLLAEAGQPADPVK